MFLKYGTLNRRIIGRSNRVLLSGKNLRKQGNMSVEEQSLKFSTLSRYAPSLVSNPRNEMSHFLMGLVDFVTEESCMAMLHGDMTLARLMVYAESIQESKHRRIDRSLKRGRDSDQGKPRFKKRD